MTSLGFNTCILEKKRNVLIWYKEEILCQVNIKNTNQAKRVEINRFLFESEAILYMFGFCFDM